MITKINSLNSNNINTKNNYQASFGSLPHKMADKIDLNKAIEKISNYSSVKQKSFEDIAHFAQEAAEKGNPKPSMLVDIMTKFVSTVEEGRKNGQSFAKSCHKAARKLYREFGINQHKGDTFNARWKYLAKKGVNEKKYPEFQRINADIDATKKPIAFTYNDLRDMFEFLRRNWKGGNAAYRNVMHGRGIKGWVKYLSEECFPTYYDDFRRKH